MNIALDQIAGCLARPMRAVMSDTATKEATKKRLKLKHAVESVGHPVHVRLLLADDQLQRAAAKELFSQPNNFQALLL
jgi:hypothetical protein